MNIKRNLVVAVLMTIVTTLMLGVIYPLVITAIAQAAREAGNMVDLDSNPTKLIEIVEIGKQILMTRGSLTTFSIRLPAAFAGNITIARPVTARGYMIPSSTVSTMVIATAGYICFSMFMSLSFGVITPTRSR